MNTTLDGHARRRAAKRALILTAATEVFFEDGYGRASMDKVLAKIGGSKRTLYNHFRSKEELFAAIVTNVSDRVLAALRPPLDAGDLRETLVTIGVGYLSVPLSPDGAESRTYSRLTLEMSRRSAAAVKLPQSTTRTNTAISVNASNFDSTISYS